MLPVLNVSPISRANKWSSIHGKRSDSELFFFDLALWFVRIQCASSWVVHVGEAGVELPLGSEKVVLHYCMILCS